MQDILFSQQHPNSPVYKDYQYPDSSSLFKRVSESYDLWQSYFLMKEANNGNALAQHELAIRYLLGKGFQADTVKSVYWTQKAAAQNLAAANYNLGIFMNNGWGTEWNPFGAYEYFLKAAQDSMVEAEYVVGLMYLDNLVVPRDLHKSYLYIKKAAASGYKPAKEVLLELNKYLAGFGYDPDPSDNTKKSQSDSTAISYVNPAVSMSYLSFREDSLNKVDDITLLKEVLREGDEELKHALGTVTISDSTLKADMKVINIVKKAAESGSPEAQTMLGRCYEKGIGVKRDLVLAAVQYIRATRLDSRRAPRLLMSLIQNPEFFSLLKTQLDRKNSDARFAYAGLVALRLNFQVPESEAFRFLKEAVAEGHVPSIVEMGMCYYTGNLTKQDKKKAIETWQQAVNMGSSEARVRIAIANVQDNFVYEDSAMSIKSLTEASSAGSLLADMALAHCYEAGTGVKMDKMQAIHYYRICLQRGSQGAYRALKRIYDQLRPGNPEFIVIGDEP
ncbi:MAG: tetratricopeptide repeat protein [Ignavibacteriales bacterium]